jgi:FMN-dependent oxidoreductase (nitrilotriacetate monooxygenase family)
MTREMKLVAFMQAQNCSNYPASWRHKAGMPDWDTPEFYARIARTLEAGKFHLAFFDDRLAIPDKMNDDYRKTVEYGVRSVKFDAATIATIMGLATSKLGLGLTYSTTYFEPFHVARLFATMDLMLGGRVAWNVVTSLNDSEAANFGAEQHLAHDLRYDRADEFMEIVTGHWNTWEPDSILRDRESGIFADPSKVHQLDYKGKFLSSRGPFTVPRSPQGQPVILQAGQSGRGRDFAARWAELVFTIYPNFAVAQKSYAAMRKALGENPAAITPAVYPIVAETRSMAEDRMAEIEKLARPEDALILLSEVLNHDFGSKPMDEPFTQEELDSLTGLLAIRDRVIQLSGKSNPTVRDFVTHSARGTIHEFPVFCGSPKDVADEMEKWFTEGACDGFVVAGSYLPGSYEDFVRLAVPELQRRGLFRKEYTGTTLRENLGLPIKGGRARQMAAE